MKFLTRLTTQACANTLTHAGWLGVHRVGGCGQGNLIRQAVGGTARHFCMQWASARRASIFDRRRAVYFGYCETTASAGARLLATDNPSQIYVRLYALQNQNTALHVALNTPM